jgi:hypothetical protein
LDDRSFVQRTHENNWLKHGRAQYARDQRNACAMVRVSSKEPGVDDVRGNGFSSTCNVKYESAVGRDTVERSGVGADVRCPIVWRRLGMVSASVRVRRAEPLVRLAGFVTMHLYGCRRGIGCGARASGEGDTPVLGSGRAHVYEHGHVDRLGLR